MRNRTFARAAVAAAMLSSLITVSANAGTVNPWDFNVFSLGDIGISGSGYGSDFQGIAGAAGSTYFNGFSLHDVASAGPGTPYSLYIGGNLEITGSIHNGGVEAGGDIRLLGADINGLVSAGGNLQGTGGTLYGDVFLGGQDLTGNEIGVDPGHTITENFAFAPTVNLGAMSAFFLNASSTAGGMAATTSATNSFGELQITAASGLNVVDIDAASLSSIWGVQIDGPSDAIVILNVDDASVSFNSLTWEYLGGASNSHTLLNLFNATTFNLSGGDHEVNILAPLAQTHFSYGLVTGNLVVGSLTGSGQVNTGGFDGGGRFDVPEPATAILLGMGVVALCGRRSLSRTRRV